MVIIFYRTVGGCSERQSVFDKSGRWCTGTLFRPFLKTSWRVEMWSEFEYAESDPFDARLARGRATRSHPSYNIQQTSKLSLPTMC